MKSRFLFIATFFFLVTSAQRTVRVGFDDVYNTILKTSQNWADKGTDIIVDSKPNIILVRVSGNKILEEKVIPYNDFIKSVRDTMDVPLYDSAGEFISKKKTEYFHSINAAIVSNSSLLSDKVGFRFNSDSKNEEKQYDYFFIKPSELNVLKKNEMKILLELIRLNVFSNKDCRTEDFSTKQGKTVKLGFFPLNGNYSDTSALINMTNNLINQYNSDFIRVHYSKNMRSYYLASDYYYNNYIKDTSAFYDTIMVNESKRIVPKFSTPPNIGISLYFDRMYDSKEGLKYAGIPFPCYTSTDIYLGNDDVFLEIKDRLKFFSSASWLFEQLVLGMYE